MEPLLEKIRISGGISGVLVPGGDGDQTKCVAYMGTVNVICRDCLSLERALRHPSEYGKVMAAKLNIAKLNAWYMRMQGI